MTSIVDTIVNQSPELLELIDRARAEEMIPENRPALRWKLLDNRQDTYLLRLYAGYNNRHGYHTGYSIVGVVDYSEREATVRHVERYRFETRVGLLIPESNVAVMLRLDESDDYEYSRYGTDDIYLLDYVNHSGCSLLSHSFGNGPHPSAYLSVGCDTGHHKLAIAREYRDHWGSIPSVRAALFSLPDGACIIDTEITELNSIGAIAINREGNVILTDRDGRMNVFVPSDGALERSDEQESYGHWQVALSFAGKERQYAERLAVALRERDISVFYDRFVDPGSIRHDLEGYLHRIYTDSSRYSVILISCAYLSGHWPMHEWRALQEKHQNGIPDYIIPVRLDDTELPGLSEPLPFLDLREASVDQIADAIRSRISRNRNNA